MTRLGHVTRLTFAPAAEYHNKENQMKIVLLGKICFFKGTLQHLLLHAQSVGRLRLGVFRGAVSVPSSFSRCDCQHLAWFKCLNIFEHSPSSSFRKRG